MRELTKSLKALANERRLRIVSVLMRWPSSSVGDIAREIELSVRSTSKHLKVLSAANVVNSRQDGLRVLYGIQQGEIIEGILPLLQ